MEVIELSDLEPISIDLNDKPKTNFGSGIELLMNDKVKNYSSATTIDLGELDRLEDELNELSNINTSTPTAPSSISDNKSFSNLFGFRKQPENNTQNIRINIDDEKTDSNLGQATMDSIGNTKTWDGFTKLNEVPLYNPSKSTGPTTSDREKRRKKRAMIKSLEQWHEKGVIKQISHFNMDSNYDEVEDEYESALEDKRKRDSVKIQQNWLITMANTIEYGNAMFDPFGVSLDGWGESISEDIDSYSEIFEQLHDKYKGGKMSPELSLLLRLGFSASVIHFSNKALSTAAPGFNDVIKQSPELMRMFTNATVDSMKQTAPGMAFASDLLNQNKPNTMNRPPPAPVDTRSMNPPPASSRPGMQFTQMPDNRPDLNAGRGSIPSNMFREQGVDMNQMGSNMNQPPTNYASEKQERSQRPEMSGPKNTDIDNILSGLKTKTINIHEQTQNTEDDSMVSIGSLKDMQGTMMPRKRSGRKNKSDKNVISLDI
jgi:hypothetical protein